VGRLMPFDQIGDITAFEEIANIGRIEPPL
jgi:hypothetical protein